MQCECGPLCGFFYGALCIVKKQKLKYVFVLLFSIFIHFSYLLYSIPLAIAFLLRKRRAFIVALFIISHFSTVGYDQASNLVGDTGLYEDKQKYILDEETKEITDYEYKTQVANTNFYRRLGPDLYNSFSTPFLGFLLILIYLSGKRIDYVDFLIASGLLIIVLGNMTGGLSRTISGRGVAIASTFFISFYNYYFT